jgi:hypothetical protein
MHALLRFCAATMMEPLHFALWTGGALARGLRLLATQEPDAPPIRRFVHCFNLISLPQNQKFKTLLSFSKTKTNKHSSPFLFCF